MDYPIFSGDYNLRIDKKPTTAVKFITLLHPLFYMSANQTPQQQQAILDKWREDASMFNAEITRLQGIVTEKKNEYQQSLKSKWSTSTWRSNLFNAYILAQNEMNQIIQEKQNAFASWVSLENPTPETKALALAY